MAPKINDAEPYVEGLCTGVPVRMYRYVFLYSSYFSIANNAFLYCKALYVHPSPKVSQGEILAVDVPPKVESESITKVAIDLSLQVCSL